MDDSVVQELQKGLNPALVSQRDGGRAGQVPYIEGHTVIAQANRIFGYGGWGYEVVGVPVCNNLTIFNNEGHESRHTAYTATVQVWVDGASPRKDVGWATVNGISPDAHETAIKGAVTDAMKRALRSFGAQFGNDLYGRGSTAQSAPARQAPARAQAVAHNDRCEEHGKAWAGTPDGRTGHPLGQGQWCYQEGE